MVYFFGIILMFIIHVSCFDLLIYRLYTYHSDKWVSQGCPVGFIYIPSGSRLFWATIFRYKYSNGLIWQTPQWIKNDPKAKKILICYRVTLAICLAGIFGFMVFALLLS